MEALDVREYLMSLPEVEEVMPFSESEAVVYEIGGKWFAVHIFERPEFFAVKCHPDRAICLRDQFPAITPAWHFNKRHWNDLLVEDLPEEVVKREIRHSYLTVIRKNVSPKALREELLRKASEADIQDAEMFE